MEHALTFSLFVLAFLSAIVLFPLVIKIAKRKGLWEANSSRKTHTEKVSGLGGMPIYFATAIALACVLMPGLNSPARVLLLGLPLLVLGVADDILDVGVSVRIVVQVLVGILVFEMGYQIVDFGSLWWLSMGATVIFVMLFINAYNFIDGINGLSGSLGTVSSLFFGFLLMSQGQIELAAVCFAYAGALAGFLVFNFGKKAKIFMGDNGSTVLGFFMATMVMAILKYDVAAGTSTSYWPVLLALTSVPAIDLIKVTAQRILQRRSPFHGDRSHIHHMLVDSSLSHPMACIVLAGWTLGFSLCAFFFPAFFSVGNAATILVGPYLLTWGIQFAGKSALKPGYQTVDARVRVN